MSSLAVFALLLHQDEDTTIFRNVGNFIAVRHGITLQQESNAAGSHAW
jgi:hypothetical protein